MTLGLIAIVITQSRVERDVGEQFPVWLEELGSPIGIVGPRVPDAEQRLVIENVLPGRYRVSTNTGVGYVAAITSGSTDLLQRPLMVSGGTIPAMEITVRDDGAELEGTLDSSKTNTAPPAPQGGFGGPQGIVYVVPTDGMDSRTRLAGLNPDGSFTVQQIAPGTYHVFALENQMQIQSVTEEWLKQHEAKVQVVRMVAGQKEHLRLPLITTSE